MRRFVLVVALVLCIASFTAYANTQQPVPVWDRLNYNYHFTSSGFDLGRPTTFNGIVPQDVFTMNVRRDANVALRPPGYGTFSGVIPTEPFTWLFPQPRTLDYWGNFGVIQLPNTIPNEDGFLTPTSIIR